MNVPGTGFEELQELLVSAMRTDSPTGEERNRRSRERSRYQCVQLVAPYDGQKRPTQADFRHVICRDLSTGGFSFVVPHPLATKQLIVALGAIPFSFVVAEVVRSELTEHGEVLVGCRFVERLKL
jgi:hypothetical protein